MIRSAFVDQRVSETLLDANQWGPPVNLDRICERNGIRLVRGARLRGGQQAHYDDAHRSISLTAERFGRAERFSIAHELGHALMKHGTRECYSFTASVDSVPMDEADTGINFEQEANNFASKLLVPREWLKKAVLEDDLTIQELRDVFEATPEVMFIALDSTKGLLDKVRTS
jgi:Zn-dependent peptidase ImmA (M78 family)